MSVPDGIQGFQGGIGPTGSPGPIGISGPIGPQGIVGSRGVTGPIGIMGGTGTQLYGNSTLIQNATSTDAIVFPLTSPDTFQNILFTAANPSLSGNKSTVITGQYDTSGLNYYGTPLTIAGSNITIPQGKYYITANVPVTAGTYITVNEEGSPVTLPYTFYLALVGPGNSTIASGIAAVGRCVCHFQHVYMPDTATTVNMRLFISHAPTSETGDLTVSQSGITASLSIVKFW